MMSERNIRIVIITVIILSLAAAGFIIFSSSPPGPGNITPLSPDHLIPLPAPDTTGMVSVEEALSGRRSVREFAATPLEISELSQLLWAAQGVTDPSGLRAAPSAGALYPLEIYVACGNVNGLLPGVYHYLPGSHAVNRIVDRDVREDLSASALGQSSVRDAPAVIIIAAEYQRTTGKYGERGIRYVHMEAGHAAENIYLQAFTLGVGTVTIGAFDDSGVVSVLGLPGNQIPLYLMPIGKRPIQNF